MLSIAIGVLTSIMTYQYMSYGGLIESPPVRLIEEARLGMVGGILINYSPIFIILGIFYVLFSVYSKEKEELRSAGFEVLMLLSYVVMVLLMLISN